MDFSQILNNLYDKLYGWVEAAVLQLPNIVVALLVLLLFVVLARVARKVVRQLMDRVSSYKQVNGLLATISYILVLFAGVMVALGIIDLDSVVGTILGGAGIITLALSFAFQDISANFVSGVLMSIRRPFREGDIIETNDYSGVVEEINLRATVLRTFQGQQVIIPNSSVYQNALINYNCYKQRRVDLSCGVAYGDDLEKAKRVAIQAIEAMDVRDTSRDVELFYNEFGGSSINFVLRYWVDFDKQTDFLSAQSEGIMRLKRAFDENDVTIPFPIRTLDFGVVGGEKLNEVLSPDLFQRSNNNRPVESTTTDQE